MGSHVLGEGGHISRDSPVSLDLIHTFSIRIESCGKFKPTIGVTDENFHLTASFKQCCEPNGWGFGGKSGNSFVYQSGVYSAASCVSLPLDSSGFTPLKTGDIVQVMFDSARRSVAFKVNGHRLTKELTGLPSRVRAFVSMRNKGDSFELLEGTVIAPIAAATGFMQVDESGIRPFSLERSLLQEVEHAVSGPFFAGSLQSSESAPFANSLLNGTSSMPPPRASFHGSRVRTLPREEDDETSTASSSGPRPGWLWDDSDVSTTRKFVGGSVHAGLPQHMNPDQEMNQRGKSGRRNSMVVNAKDTSAGFLDSAAALEMRSQRMCSARAEAEDRHAPWIRFDERLATVNNRESVEVDLGKGGHRFKLQRKRGAGSRKRSSAQEVAYDMHGRAHSAKHADVIRKKCALASAMLSLERMHKRCTKKEMNIEKQFAKHDIDNSGMFDRQELFSAIKTLGVKLGHVQQDALWAHIDADGNGQVNYHEFLWMCNADQAMLMKKWKLLNRSLTRQQMLLHFDQFDTYHRGGLDCEQFMRALRAMIPDVIFSERDSKKLFAHFDASGDGLLQSDEFMTIMEQNVMQEASDHTKGIEQTDRSGKKTHVRGTNRRGSFGQKMNLGLRLTKQVFADVAKEQEKEDMALARIKVRGGAFGGPVARARKRWAKAREVMKKAKKELIEEEANIASAEADESMEEAQLERQVLDKVSALTLEVKARRAQESNSSDPTDPTSHSSDLASEYSGATLAFVLAYEQLMDASAKLENATIAEAARDKQQENEYQARLVALDLDAQS
jgi:Ca2+-binding EF-hand superfamily protein